MARVLSPVAHHHPMQRRACWRLESGWRQLGGFVFLDFFIFLESLPLRASGARLLERDLKLVSQAFFISLELLQSHASGERLLERLGLPPQYTRKNPLHFLPRHGAWPSPAVTMSSALVGDTTRRINGPVRIKVVWFGRIVSDKLLRIFSLQMALESVV